MHGTRHEEACEVSQRDGAHARGGKAREEGLVGGELGGDFQKNEREHGAPEPAIGSRTVAGGGILGELGEGEKCEGGGDEAGEAAVGGERGIEREEREADHAGGDREQEACAGRRETFGPDGREGEDDEVPNEVTRTKVNEVTGPEPPVFAAEDGGAFIEERRREGRLRGDDEREDDHEDGGDGERYAR